MHSLPCAAPLRNNVHAGFLACLLAQVGVDVKVQSFEGVLHAWHTFFPLMPRAVTALEQAAAFLCEHLGLPPPTTASTANARAQSVLPAVDPGQEAAAIKLQAMQRGKQARKALPKLANPQP